MRNEFLISHFSFLISDGVRYGGLAQLARAPALQAGGQRFESVILHFEASLGLLRLLRGYSDYSGSKGPQEFFDILTQARL